MYFLFLNKKMNAIYSQDFPLETRRFPPRCYEPQRIFGNLEFFALPDTIFLNNVQIPARMNFLRYQTLSIELVTQAALRQARCTRYALNISF